MKKIIIFLVCVCFLTMPAMAAEPTCNGGSTITAKNGTKFCKSDKAMNWWSAFTWCESQGRSLAEFSKMCPNVPQYPTNTEGECPNLQGLPEDGWVWSSLAMSNNAAIVVNLSSGAACGFHRYGTKETFALCE